MKMYLSIFLLLSLSISNSIKINNDEYEIENISSDTNILKCFSIDYYNIGDRNCNLDVFWNLKAHCSDSCVLLIPNTDNFITGVTNINYSMIIHCNGSIEFYKGQYCNTFVNTFEVSLPHCFPNKQNQNPLMINLLDCNELDTYNYSSKINNLIAFLIFMIILIYVVYAYFTLFFRKNNCKYFFKKIFKKKLNMN